MACCLSLGHVFAQTRVDTNQVQGAWALKEIVDGDTLSRALSPTNDPAPAFVTRSIPIARLYLPCFSAFWQAVATRSGEWNS